MREERRVVIKPQPVKIYRKPPKGKIKVKTEGAGPLIKREVMGDEVTIPHRDGGEIVMWKVKVPKKRVSVQNPQVLLVRGHRRVKGEEPKPIRDTKSREQVEQWIKESDLEGDVEW